MKRLLSNKEVHLQIVLLVVISAAVYLPRIGQLQYYKDDWYYVLDGLYGGPAVFNEMFAIDRPARGPFFQAYFSLFGANPLPYHLGHYFWRVSAALAALWLFRMLWPRPARLAFFKALFLLIYPG
jgi:4-amino-4-deoxy-L-arabinose transferase-like glycosyltransferase